MMESNEVKTPRTKQDIDIEYSNNCATLGNKYVLYCRLHSDIELLKVKCEELNDEAKMLAAQEILNKSAQPK